MEKEKIEDEQDVKRALKEIMANILNIAEPKLNLETIPSVILVIGVNGVGKTTLLKCITNLLPLSKGVAKLNDEDVIAVLSKQIKTRKESIVEFEKAGRTDLIEQTTKEIEKLEKQVNKCKSENEKITILKYDKNTTTTNIVKIKKMKYYIRIKSLEVNRV